VGVGLAVLDASNVMGNSWVVWSVCGFPFWTVRHGRAALGALFDSIVVGAMS